MELKNKYVFLCAASDYQYKPQCLGTEVDDKTTRMKFS